jgi:SAM-dependent methyltransferase
MQTPFNVSSLFEKVSKSLYEGKSGYLLNKTHKHLTKFGNRKNEIKKANTNRILEIGAGKGELYTYIKGNYDQYFMTDVSSWGKEEIEKITETDKRVVFELQDIENLKYQDNFFDRVLVTCGIISMAVSTDPSILLRIIRKLLIIKKMKNLDIPYELFIATQHRNNPLGILGMVNWIYRKDKIYTKYYPFKLKLWNFSTHIIVNIIKAS